MKYGHFYFLFVWEQITIFTYNIQAYVPRQPSW